MEAPAASAGAAPAADAVRAAARAFERDRYLSALLAPAAVRDDLIALAAFAGEIARIPASVSEPMVGEIRLQWWRDTLDAALRTGISATGHPIADALAGTMRRHRLDASLIHGLLDAMAERLDDLPFADTTVLDRHLAAWDGGLFRLAWHVLGGIGEPPRLLAEAGEVYGMSRCLIEAPVELAQGRVVLPRALMDAHGITLENARAPAAAAGWRTLQASLAAASGERARPVLASYQVADAKVRLAALPLALVKPYLRVSERIDVAALEAHDVAPLTRVWRLWLVSRTGRA